MTRLVIAAYAAVGLLFVGTSCSLPAVADPGEIVPAPPPPPPIPWLQLGRSDRLEILGSDEPFDTNIPVPEAVAPGVMTGVVGSAVDVIDGRVDVLDARDVVLGSIPTSTDPKPVPFAVDIGAAQIIDGVAKLSFVLRDRNPPGDSCSRPPSVTLSQLGSTYLGQSPYPAVVADFKPGFVEQFLIRTGPVPTPAQQQAALDLVAMLTRYYRPVPVRFEIDLSSDPVPPGPPTRRIIELAETEPAGITVANPSAPEATLVISGSGSELSQQVQLFFDQRVQLAQTSSAAVKSVAVEKPQADKLKTFAQLGMTGNIAVLGNATLYIGFDAGQFAVGPIQGAKIRLRAHYTPVTGGEGSLVVRSGDSVIATRRLDESGQLDLTATVPAAAIASNVGIALDLRYLPSQRCAPLNDKMRFTVDPDSTVEVVAGTRNRGGFPVLPMAFTPNFNVAIDRPEHLGFAARAISLLGRQTAVVLQPHLASLNEASTSGLGSLIVASGEDLTRAGLKPPVRWDGPDSVVIDGAPTTDVDLNGPIGVIQAFSNGDAAILAINADQDWSLVDRCFDYIGSLPSQWASLIGDVVATGAAGRSVNLTLRQGGAAVDEDPGDSWKWWTWASLAAVAGSVVTSGVLLWHRWFRRRRG